MRKRGGHFDKPTAEIVVTVSRAWHPPTPSSVPCAVRAFSSFGLTLGSPESGLCQWRALCRVLFFQYLEGILASC